MDFIVQPPRTARVGYTIPGTIIVRLCTTNTDPDYAATDSPNLMAVAALIPGPNSTAPSDPHVSLFAGLGYKQGNFAWAAGQYDALGRVEPPIFTQFKDNVEAYGTAKIMSTARVTSGSDLADELNRSEPAGMRSRFTTATFSADVGLLALMVDIFVEQVQKALDNGLQDDQGFAPMLGIQPLTQNILKAQTTRGGNVMGLHDDQAPLVGESCHTTFFR